MTTLPTRAAALRTRLTRLRELSASVDEAADLEGLRVQLARPVERFAGQMEKCRLLAKAGISVSEPVTAISARKKATTLLERFSAAPKPGTLKKGQAWPTLLAEIDVAVKELQTSVSATWKAERSILFSGETPSAIDGKLAKTRSNQEALKRYRVLYSQFRSLFDSEPSDLSVIANARRLGRELEEAAKAFKFDVPSEVKVFLEAVQSVSGAPISLLTAEVLKWLHENDGLDAYRVKSSDPP